MRLLLVDDHADVRLSLTSFVEQLGHEVQQVSDGAAALKLTDTWHPDLILSDLRMPGMDGLGLLEALEAYDDPPPLALMTAFGDTATAIAALRQGAIDYLRKPIDVRELHRLIERIASAGTEPVAIPPSVREEPDGLVVQSAALAKVVAHADRLHAAKDLPCLIEGETGSGKELIARRIHHGGKPATAGPFVAVNCAAISQGLFEAELFGYVAGAFTGALTHGSEGKLALAAKGTVLLDELADLPLDQQAKLLRVLEERSWYPVGSNQLRQLTARVVCACNADLLEAVRTGRFREDLYYRLKVGHLRIPPLRERREDILPLARAFLIRIRKQRGRGFQKLSSAAELLLSTYHWPGNVRQLYHLLEQVGVLADGAVLDAPLLAEHLPHTPTSTPVLLGNEPLLDPGAVRLPDSGFDLDAWNKAVVLAALERHAGSPVRTATYLGLTRKVLYTLRKRYGLLGRDQGGDE